MNQHERRPDTHASTEPENWVDEHGDALFAYALMRVGDRGVVEDIVQETFLAALGARERFAGQSSIRTWLIGILRRKIADHHRRRAREIAVSDEELAARYDPRQYRRDPLRSWNDDPARILEDKEFWRVFHRCAGELPETLADAYYLRELAELTTEEICKILDVTPTNLALRIYRARAYLRQCLDKNWFRSGDPET